MNVRIASAALAIFLACPWICGANSIPAKGKSSYGGPTTGFLTVDTSQDLGSGFTASLDDSFSNGTDSYLEIDTPNLSGGTITISGLGDLLVFDSVFCSATSFLGTCDPDGSTPLTTAQNNCLNTLSETNPSPGVFTFTAPTCTISGSYSMALIFTNSDDSSLTGYDLASISASRSPASTAPEPGSLLLLAFGLVGLFIGSRLLRQAGSLS